MQPVTDASISLFQLEGQSLDDIMESRRFVIVDNVYDSERPNDRATTTLQSGKTISAALTKHLRDGERIFVVDLDVKP